MDSTLLRVKRSYIQGLNIPTDILFGKKAAPDPRQARKSAKKSNKIGEQNYMIGGRICRFETDTYALKPFCPSGYVYSALRCGDVYLQIRTPWF